MRGMLLRAIGTEPGLFDRRVWLLTLGQLLLSVGRGVMMPFATIYFYNERGFPLAIIGLTFAIAMPAGSVVGLAWGALADRVGRKPLMALGFAGSAVATAALAFVQNVPQYMTVVIANFVFLSAFNPASRAMIADVTPADRRTRAYGLQYLANNAGISAGILLGGVLAIFLPYRALFFVEAAGFLGYLAVVLLFVRESLARGAEAAGPERVRDGARRGLRDSAAAQALARVASHFRGIDRPLRDARFLLFALCGVLAGLGWAQFYITYSPYMKNYLDFADTQIALAFAINTVMVVLLQVVVASWAERRKRTNVYLVANHLLAWSLLLTWLAGRVEGNALRFSVLAAGIAVMTLGEIMVVPVGAALVAGLASRATDFGKYMAAFDLTWTVSSGLGAVVGGLFFDVGRPMLLWPAMTAFVVLSFGGYVLLARMLPREVNQPSLAAPPALAPAAEA